MWAILVSCRRTRSHQRVWLSVGNASRWFGSGHHVRARGRERKLRIKTIMISQLLVVMLIIGIITVPALPQVHAASATNFNNIVIVAMENQNYADVMGTGTGSSSAPFITSMLVTGATVPLYHGYGAAGRPVNGCSAGCYTALISGSDQGISNGYSCCITAPTLIDSMTAAGLSWNAFCQNGCPRGNDHFPFTGFAGTANSPNIMGSSCCSGQPDPEFVAPMNSASPPNFIWLTPTDGNNMHDNSIQSGDAYLHDLLVGPAGSLGSPAAGSVLASNLFTPGHRTMLMIWWDEYDPAPIMFYRPGVVKQALISASDVYDEYSVLHLIENNWALPTLTSNDAAALSMTEIYGLLNPPPSGGSSGGSGNGSNGSCLLCGTFPSLSTSMWLLVVGGLMGFVGSLTLLTIRARANLASPKRKMNRLSH